MKTTFTFFLFFFLVASLISVSAQDYNSYDISNYYTPDIRRNALDLDLSGRSNHGNNKFSDWKHSNIEGDFQASLHHFTHTRKRYSSLAASIAFEGSTSKTENENDISKYSYFNPGLSFSNINRFYNSSNAFISFGGGAQWSPRKDYSFYDSPANQDIEELTEKLNAYMISLQIGVGKGRLESVEDARQAIYILDNLSKKGVLTRKLTDHEIFTLSQLISTVKNKRFFDSRLHLIEEITRVDSFFVHNELLESSDASYFTTLYDYWQHGALFERLSGKMFQSHISGDIRRGTQKNEWLGEEPVDIYDNRHQNFHWNNQLSYEKPVNLFWQNSINATFSIGYLRQRLERVGPDPFWENNLNYSLSGSYSWAYYPNSRTNLSVGASQQFLFSRAVSPFEAERSYENGGKSFSTRSSIGGNLNYYISPQFRLTAWISSFFEYQKGILGVRSDDANYSNITLRSGLTLTYSIY